MSSGVGAGVVGDFVGRWVVGCFVGRFVGRGVWWCRRLRLGLPFSDNFIQYRAGIFCSLSRVQTQSTWSGVDSHPVIMSFSHPNEFITSLRHGIRVTILFRFLHGFIKDLVSNGSACPFFMAALFTTFVEGIAQLRVRRHGCPSHTTVAAVELNAS